MPSVVRWLGVFGGAGQLHIGGGGHITHWLIGGIIGGLLWDCPVLLLDLLEEVDPSVSEVRLRFAVTSRPTSGNRLALVMPYTAIADSSLAIAACTLGLSFIAWYSSSSSFGSLNTFHHGMKEASTSTCSGSGQLADVIDVGAGSFQEVAVGVCSGGAS